MQHPILTALDGGASIPTDVAARQERDGWAAVADGVERALSCLDPHHPERQAFVEMWAECRRAAGLPAVPALSLTA